MPYVFSIKYDRFRGRSDAAGKFSSKSKRDNLHRIKAQGVAVRLIEAYRHPTWAQ